MADTPISGARRHPAGTAPGGPAAEPEAAAAREAEAATAPADGPGPLGWSRGDTVRTVLALTLAGALLTGAWIIHRADGFGATASFSLLAGAALGILFERGRFCFYCIFRDLFEKGDSRGAYSVLAALATGTVGYVLVFTIRQADPVTGRLPTAAHIAPVSVALVVAGLAFGIGIVLSGGCIAGHLYRLGEGSLRALPGLAGVLGGFGAGFLTWNPLHATFIRGAPVPWLPATFGYAGALLLQLAVLAALGVLLLRWNPPQPARAPLRVDRTEIRRALFFRRWPALLTGGLVGLVGFLAYLRVEPLGVTLQLSGLTRTAMDSGGLLPGTLQGLDTSLAGCVALVVETVTDNGWLIIGIVAGSLAAALPGRRVTLEPVTVRDGATALLGGVLLGWGAVIGLGCTVGVLLSGTQALALSGWVFAAAVLSGLALGFRAGLHRS
ncbi:YeeE/YedE family protein [Streptomyces sp. SM14]|uniref:YeeE/YedE family protein n=2 Tax=unclassified Streptomyces TaxID=2593676 RepID=UPI000CD51A62|nr:YeeE/YedE family protein [Streptomyces sp. SM14]